MVKNIEITSKSMVPDKRTKVFLDRQDISRQTKRIAVIMEAGKPTEVIVSFYPHTMTLKTMYKEIRKVKDEPKTFYGFVKDALSSWYRGKH